MLWTSSKPNVAAVDENGPVSAIGKVIRLLQLVLKMGN
ncbi:hypothetical protein [Paenibacillus anaericanus]